MVERKEREGYGKDDKKQPKRNRSLMLGLQKFKKLWDRPTASDFFLVNDDTET